MLLRHQTNQEEGDAFGKARTGRAELQLLGGWTGEAISYSSAASLNIDPKLLLK